MAGATFARFSSMLMHNAR